jgi:hypothetical protein
MFFLSLSIENLLKDVNILLHFRDLYRFITALKRHHLSILLIERAVILEDPVLFALHEAKELDPIDFKAPFHSDVLDREFELILHDVE